MDKDEDGKRGDVEEDTGKPGSSSKRFSSSGASGIVVPGVGSRGARLLTGEARKGTHEEMDAERDEDIEEPGISSYANHHTPIGGGGGGSKSTIASLLKPPIDVIKTAAVAVLSGATAVAGGGESPSPRRCGAALWEFHENYKSASLMTLSLTSS